MIENQDWCVEMIICNVADRRVISTFFALVNNIPWGLAYQTPDQIKQAIALFSNENNSNGLNDSFAREISSHTLWDNTELTLFEFASAPSQMFLAKHRHEWSYTSGVEEVERELSLKRKKFAGSGLSDQKWFAYENKQRKNKQAKKSRYNAVREKIQKDMQEKGLIVPTRFASMIKPCWIPIL